MPQGRPTKHSLVRTSPKGKGQDYIGTCTKCGKENLTFEDMKIEECPNIRGVTEKEALMEALGEKEWQN